MDTSRRGLLSMFGISAAVVAVPSAASGTTLEKVSDPGVKPFPPAEEQFRQGRYVLPSLMDVQKGRLYSAFEADADTHTPDRIQFFHYPVGVAVPWGNHATHNDTDMVMANSLPAPEHFCVQRVGVVFSPICDPDDRARFIDNYTVTVWIGMKWYFRRPLSEAFAVGTSKYEPEYPSMGLVDLAPLPLIIQSQQHFSAELEGTGVLLEKRLRMWCVFDGLDARGVQ